MAATLKQAPGQHNWRFSDQPVTQLLIDPGEFRFRSWTLSDSLEIRCGVPFRFAEADGREWIVDPTAHEQLAPLLTLLGRMLEEMEISRDGSLSVRFGDGSRIQVAPHPEYEAWEAHGGGRLEGLGYLCGPGGGSPWG